MCPEQATLQVRRHLLVPYPMIDGRSYSHVTLVKEWMRVKGVVKSVPLSSLKAVMLLRTARALPARVIRNWGVAMG